LTPEKLGKAGLIEEASLSDDSKILKITGVQGAKTVSVLVRGSNQLVTLKINDFILPFN